MNFIISVYKKGKYGDNKSENDNIVQRRNMIKIESRIYKILSGKEENL